MKCITSLLCCLCVARSYNRVSFVMVFYNYTQLFLWFSKTYTFQPLKYNFVETPRNFIITKLLICKLGSSYQELIAAIVCHFAFFCLASFYCVWLKQDPNFFCIGCIKVSYNIWASCSIPVSIMPILWSKFSILRLGCEHLRSCTDYCIS